MQNSVEANRRLADFAYDNSLSTVGSSPEIFAIESTNHCNIKCIMCPRGEPDIMTREVGHMPEDTLDVILSQARFFGDICWLHWFGEPLMNPRIYDIIRKAKQTIPNTGISTNATLLRPAAQQKLLEAGIDTVMIAIDGDTKEVYEAVRKSARFTFEEVVANAEGFLAACARYEGKKPHVKLSIIVMEKTESDLESYRKHWESLGADEVLFKPYTNWGGQYAETFENLERDELRAELKKKRPHPCEVLWKNVVIAWDGKVLPCCYDFDAKMVMGNIHEQSLDEIWNGEKYVELRRAELEGRNNCELCANCSQAPGRPQAPEGDMLEDEQILVPAGNAFAQMRAKLAQFGRHLWS